MVKRVSCDEACGPETLLAALSAPLYRDLTEEERLHAHVFSDFVDSKRVNKGPTLSASTERVFDAFSDFLEDRNFARYDHFSRFQEDKWFWNALFDRYGFSTGGGLGSKRTSGFSVNGSRDLKDACTESVSLEDPDPDRCDFRVFCGKTRLSLVTNALMKYAGDLVSDEVLNEIIDAFDRTGVNNLTTEERYRTSHLHGLVTAMAENGVSVPEAVRDWIVDHRAALSEKIYSHNAQFRRSRSGDFFQETLRWQRWDALLRSTDKRRHTESEEESSSEIESVYTTKAAEFMQLENVKQDPEAWVKMKDFRQAFLVDFCGEDVSNRKNAVTNEDLRTLFEPFGLKFFRNKRRDGVRSDWVNGITI
eukprot:jgi/Mesvir1/14078/Mv20409-RA.1